MKTASFFRHPGVVLVMVCLCVGGLAQAVTSTGQQTVRAQVNPSCTVSYTQPMAFGNLTATPSMEVSKTDLKRAITVSCTAGASYSVVAGDGNNYSVGWRMVNGSSQYLTYQLFTDPGRTTTFPRSGTTVGGTATGVVQTVDVYGRVPAQTAGGIGDFTDSVTFTVTY